MTMMKDPLPNPIDLSVPKLTGPHIQTYPSALNQQKTISSTISSQYAGVHPPNVNFYGHMEVDYKLTASMMPENLAKLHNAAKIMGRQHQHFDLSPKSSRRNVEESTLTNIQNKINLQEESLQRTLKRSLSGVTSTNFISDNDNFDSNNNRDRSPEPPMVKIEPQYSPEKKKPKKLRKISDNLDVYSSDLPPSPTSTSSSESDHCDSSTKTRIPRPFKALSNGLLLDPVSVTTPLGDFETFRQKILSNMKSNKSSNQNMRRQTNANCQTADPEYLEKRRKNNEAAKRSRDARRRKEDEVAIRCAYLERERMMLLQEIKMLRDAVHKYQCGLIR